MIVDEADQPDVLGDLLHPRLTVGKYLTEIDLAPLVEDAAAPGHDGRPVVKWVVQLVTAVALAASYLPARRDTTIDPIPASRVT